MTEETQTPIDKTIAGYKGVITKKETEIAKLEASLEKKQTFLQRISSRKFLLSAIPSLLTLVGAVVVFFGYELTPEQNTSLSIIGTTLVSLISLFIVPEAITDYKERMAEAGDESSKKIDATEGGK